MYGANLFGPELYKSSNPDADRTKRIRDAKSEAQKEIEEYKNQKEEEFKKFEAEVRSACSTSSRYQRKG